MILILGAGFIGSSLGNHLTAKGYPIRLFSRNLPTDKSKAFFRGDISEIEKYDDIFNGVSTIIHTIHTTVPANSGDDELYDVETNVGSLIKLLKICRRKRTENFIYISSGGAIYGNPIDESPCCENSPTNPISSYGITKLACEKYLLLHKELFSGKCAILRPSNIYGETQKSARPQGLVKYLINAVQNNQKFQIWGDGNGKKDYLYIEDFNRAVEKIIDFDGILEQNIFNLGSDHTYSVNQIIAIFERTFGKKIEVEYDLPKPFDVQDIRLDSTRFKEAFGWKSTMTMETFVSKLYGRT